MEQNRRDRRSYDQDNWNRGNDTYNRENDMNSGNYENYDRNRDRDYMNNPSRNYGGYDRDYDYNTSRNYGNRGDMYGSNTGDYDRGGSSGTYSSDYDRERQNINEYGFGGYGNYGNRNWGRGSSSEYGNYDDYDRWSNREYGRNDRRSNDYRSSNRSDWERNRHMDRDWDRNRHMGQDRDWWDRTKDEVSSWFGDDDAERRRRMDQHSGHRGKGPKNYRRSDDRIREDVCDRLSDDYTVDASDVDIEVKGAEVILKGTVNSRDAKRRAEDIAESVSGVNNVQNQLRVQHPTSSSNYNNSQSMGSTTGTTGTTNRS